jgi:uncharacterized protein YegP (UPF0339 family)
MSDGPAFYVYADGAGEWRWSLVAPSDRIVGASGEGYPKREECLKAVERVDAYLHDTRLHLHPDQPPPGR